MRGRTSSRSGESCGVTSATTSASKEKGARRSCQLKPRSCTYACAQRAMNSEEMRTSRRHAGTRKRTGENVMPACVRDESGKPMRPLFMLWNSSLTRTPCGATIPRPRRPSRAGLHQTLPRLSGNLVSCVWLADAREQVDTPPPDRASLVATLASMTAHRWAERGVGPCWRQATGRVYQSICHISKR